MANLFLIRKSPSHFLKTAKNQGCIFSQHTRPETPENPTKTAFSHPENRSPAGNGFLPFVLHLLMALIIQRMLTKRNKKSDAGCRIPDAGCWILDA